MKGLQVLCLTLLCLLVVEGQVIHPGKCPEPPVQQGFDVSKYLGRWYEIQKLPNVFQMGECAQATYTLGDGVVNVLNAELLPDGTVSEAQGTAKQVDPNEPAKLEVTFYPGSPPGAYWVLDTDYENYTLVYGCRNLASQYADYAWIMSRTRTLPEETLQRLRNTLTSNGISIDKLVTTNQGICDSMPQEGNKS